MNFLNGMFSNKVLMCSVFAWFSAQFFKILLTYFETKKFDLSRMVGSGGMPSSHSAFVMSLSTSLGIVNGFHSSIYALGLCFALIVMYDAAGVRRAAGKQAEVLNSIIDSISHNRKVPNEKLKELIGHTPKQVFAGAILGIIIANIFMR